MSPGDLVRVRDLLHRYDDHVVLDVPRLDLGPGLHQLEGPNGAGKTTLLRILATLLTPARGRVHVAGHGLHEAPHEARARLGHAGHRVALHPPLTVHRALALHARLHRLPPERAREALEAWGLDAVAERPVRALSHGQARRADLARATLHEPRVLLLDEPAAGLDEAGRALLAGHLADRPGGTLTLVATHEADTPGPAATTLRMEAGRLVEEGGP